MPGVEDRLLALEEQVTRALEIAQGHGPEHRNEGADPLPGESQTKPTAGAPTHRAPFGTRCSVAPDKAVYFNTDGGTSWTLFESGGAGAPTGVDYLVGSASGDLTNEIVVGTTPGGELGNTWASPTVDATHSGSAHHADSHTLASHSAKAHGDLSDAPASAHHTKYTDGEARTAVPFQLYIPLGNAEDGSPVTP